MKQDGRRNNGGNKNAGRKPKAIEQQARKLGTDAIIKTYGSIEKYWQTIADQAKESFPHLKLIHEHVYGKAVETKDITIREQPPIEITYVGSGINNINQEDFRA